jgi:hypothetical protein
MNDGRRSENHSDHIEIPSALLDDLAALYDRHIDVPSEIDARVKKATWRHFAETRQRQIPLIRWMAPLAAAAVVAIVLLSVGRGYRESVVSPPSSGMRAVEGVVARDFDGDGRFDIIDVLALAQDLESGLVIDTRWDANGDGGVDAEDVDLMGQNAVAMY